MVAAEEGGLYLPDMIPDSPVDALDALELFGQWASDQGLALWEHQDEALMDLAVGDHVILGTPTGSGKSLVACGLHFMALAAGRRSYYTAPIKALVSEKFFNLVDIFGRDNVGMITGDSTINPQAPIICCTAEILANQALREGDKANVDCVVMDEFHFYGDPDRGWAWQVPLIELTSAQFLLMSATLGDVSDIAKRLQERSGRAVDLVLNAQRPVPLSYEYVLTPIEGTVELALRAGEAPIYIVHFAQDAALSTAQSLASYGVASKEQRAAIKEALHGARFTTAFGKILQRLLLAGVGVHHAGMLPRYRLLVEKLAQQGLLPVICGTDTLGVGINVPIHTVLLTALTKYDGHRMRRLRAREFHQIAGRAGRSGFDTEGKVIAEAPEHEVENARLLAKAGDDPKKQRKVHRRQPPEGFISWNKQNFERLVDAPPETLVPRMRITHSMILAMVGQGGDARERVNNLIDASAQTDEEKATLHARSEEVFSTLISAGVIDFEENEELGVADYYTTIDLPDDFALDQPLSPFMLAALELLEPESETYALDLISIVEATLDNPSQVLRAQERQAKDKAMSEMKADGIEYDERIEKLAEVTYPKPLEALLDAAFDRYCESVPWARDYRLAPKSVLRDMLETASDFKEYIQRYNIARSEGTLLRYLSDAYRVLERSVPLDKRDDYVWDTIDWLGFLVRTTDSSLVDEWEAAGELPEVAMPEGAPPVVADRRGLTVLVRNALFLRVRMASLGHTDRLGRLDVAWGFGEQHWRKSLDAYHEVHETIRIDAESRSTEFFSVDESDEEALHVWHVHQIFNDEDSDRDFGIMADLDIDASQEEGEAVFKRFRVGFIEELFGEE